MSKITHIISEGNKWYVDNADQIDCDPAIRSPKKQIGVFQLVNQETA